MQHPFALKISDLESQVSGKDLVEEIESSEAESISGGLSIHTVEGKEEGGFCYPIYPLPVPICPPEVTSLAIGEEGGDFPCIIEIKPKPEPIKPPYATTEAVGEEGGDCFLIF